MSAQYFAQLNDDNVVIDVHVVTAEFIEANPERYLGVWVETFYDSSGKTYAAVDYLYDSVTQDFTPPPLLEPYVPPVA